MNSYTFTEAELMAMLDKASYKFNQNKGSGVVSPASLYWNGYGAAVKEIMRMCRRRAEGQGHGS